MASVLAGLLALALIVIPGGGAEARYAAYVLDVQTGKVLYARNATQQRHPASLTKMMTLYMVFDALRQGRLTLDTPLTVSKRAAGQPPSRLGLRPGDTISVRHAILALVTKSANDVATVVAESLADSETQFALRMTERARQLGMSRTTFRNASGLPNRRQLSTAQDMAKLAIALQRDFPQYYHLFKTRTFSYRGRTHRNHNNLLADYQGTDGIKTGYIRASGFNLVASVRRANLHLIGVVFGGRTARSRDAHLKRLLDRGFTEARELMMAAAPPVPKRRPEPDDGRATTAAVVVPQPRPAAPAPGRQDATDAWGIQVGAYSTKANAARMIATAKQHLPSMLGDAEASIQKATLDHGTFYRARLLGLPQAEARQACAMLVVREVPCVPVPAELGVEVAEAPR